MTPPNNERRVLAWAEYGDGESGWTIDTYNHIQKRWVEASAWGYKITAWRELLGKPVLEER